ncbi:4-hydroxy-tetrahydrodipicolinate synthase [Fructobacillus sp. M2-14]|uniref:4-hydroxy-tetrahydrodipicolinate synthase n=1 Tax=Fructobacillus broussonetiae TaxID=2713173 RepID=A0ABS5QYC3_9LACO|nr:4-hydroxy-tetrahydrodipicolinate synthase [Fructobacillus broussonetiae]MBS9338183.1 4-hydroxy-tetrahydrodipicolinate synthase [Fructobacillus broussonetiae]
MFENMDLVTAIVTPFNDMNEIDFETLEELTNRYIKEGHRGFIIGGTTGEAPTLSHEEKLELYRRFAEMVAGRVPIIAGTGSNNTAATIAFTKEVSEIEGISAALVVVPYYNKPSQRQMLAHFEAVADGGNLPVIIYNVPGRAAVTMANDTIVALSQHPNIIGVKQCTSVSDLEYLVDHTAENFAVYSGEDAQALFARVAGATGIISVASHLYGKEMRAMYDALYSGRYQWAGKLQRWLTPRMNALFMFPSPAPVKALLNEEGHQVGSCRLPILPLNEEEEEQLHAALNAEEVFS